MQQGEKYAATRHTLFCLAGRSLTWDFCELSTEICLHFASSLLIVVAVSWALTLFTVRNVVCQHVNWLKCMRLMVNAWDFRVLPQGLLSTNQKSFKPSLTHTRLQTSFNISEIWWGIPWQDDLASSPSCSVYQRYRFIPVNNVKQSVSLYLCQTNPSLMSMQIWVTTPKCSLLLSLNINCF